MKHFLPILLTLVFLSPFSARGENTVLRIGAHTANVEIADTLPRQTLGLMGRTSLCTDCGMLFVFEQPERREFWMKNTLLPLSIAFIDAAGVIINIENMQPETIDIHFSQGPALYALEMKQGWFKHKGIAPGDKVQGLPHAAAR